MKKIIAIILMFILNSCVTNYYYVSVDEDSTIYNSKGGSEPIVIIPKGSRVYITKSDKNYRKIKWNKYKGWTENLVYSNTSIPNNYSSSNYNSSSNSYQRSSTKTSSGGGTVHVKGYTRKNGTYVSPHTRSAPRRR